MHAQAHINMLYAFVSCMPPAACCKLDYSYCCLVNQVEFQRRASLDSTRVTPCRSQPGKDNGALHCFPQASQRLLASIPAPCGTPTTLHEEMMLTHSVVYTCAVAQVRVSKDRKVATVLWDCYPEGVEACGKEIALHTGRLRSALAAALNTKFAPALAFRHDHLPPHQGRLAETFEQVCEGGLEVSRGAPPLFAMWGVELLFSDSDRNLQLDDTT